MRRTQIAHCNGSRCQGFTLVQDRALHALEATLFTVEVHLANDLPSFTLVGLTNVGLKETRERLSCAIQNAGLGLPHNQRIIVNLDGSPTTALAHVAEAMQYRRIAKDMCQTARQ